MTPLSRREERAWRRIERSLREDAPRLASLGAELDAGRSDVTGARVGTVFCAVALLLILAGIALGEWQMVLGGLSVLGVLPLMMTLVVLANRGGRPNPGSAG
jgi:ferric-dicitrate binding protein FerR (iron transport regulator)